MGQLSGSFKRSDTVYLNIDSADGLTSGDIWMDHANAGIKVYNGTSWESVGNSSNSSVIDWKTPQDFGAAGDGVTDDTQALKDWLQGATELYAPPGTYLVDQQVGNDGVRASITDSINVVCHSKAIFKANTGLDYDMIQVKPSTSGFTEDREISVFWRGGTFDQRLQAMSTSVPFGSTFPAGGPGGQGTSAITDGLSIRGEVDDNGVRKAGFTKVLVEGAQFIASDPTNPHWQTSGGDSGIFIAGTQHQEVNDCTFFGNRDLGIYGSGLSTNAIIPDSSANYRNNVFYGCMFGVTSKRNMDNVIMINNIGINCGGLCAASDATGTTGANNLFSGNMGTNCGYIVNLKVGSNLSAVNNHSYEHGHIDKDGNAFTSVFNEDDENACVLVEGSEGCDISTNVVHSVDSRITAANIPVYTVLMREDNSDISSENFVFNNTGRQVDSVVKDKANNAEYTFAWNNYGRQMQTQIPVDLNYDDGSANWSGPLEDDNSTFTLSGTTATTDMKSFVVKSKTLNQFDRLRIVAGGTISGTAGQKNLGIRSGGLAFRGVTFDASVEGDFLLDIEVEIEDSTPGSESQRIIGKVMVEGNVGVVYQAETADTSISDLNLRVVGRTLNSSDTITVNTFRITFV